VHSLARNDWSSVLLEIRALLHPFLRYHPNIVRLLGLHWSSGNGSASVYPVLAMEYARHGSLSALQESTTLRTQVKQKLCYDVARGLSILHACGIVHGDMKHENVLVFDNPYDEPKDQPYLAKLADFGGAAMDISLNASQSLILGTFPYDAPEASSVLSAEGLKKTDVFSFGFLVWRTLLDGMDMRGPLGLAGYDIGQARIITRALKQEDKLIELAIHSATKYYSKYAIHVSTYEMVLYVLYKTIRANPAERSLPDAQLALQGMKVNKIDDFMRQVTAKNERERKRTEEEDDGIRRWTMNVDSVGFNLGKMGDFYDAQENIPGYRPELPHPETGEFLFEPFKLKELLTWSQQEQIVEELKIAARAKQTNSVVELPPFRAAYYVFQSHLAGFGVKFNAQEACHWLHEASKSDDDCTVDYFAQAWLWRVCNALDCPQLTTQESLFQNIKLGIIRGHRLCLSDSRIISERLVLPDDKAKFQKEVDSGKNIFLTLAGGVGMPHYAERKLRKDWNLDNLQILDTQIKEELGEKYNECLRATPSQDDDPVKTLKESPFNKLFVNHVGHGLLHYAATFGKLEALKHILKTYKCDINVGNELLHETPLLCAVRSVQYQCAVFLLNAGAAPGSHELGDEAALHWLSAFELQQNEMESLAKRILDAGADIEEPCGISARRINADWEDLLEIPVTPLGRAVIMRSVPAVRVLLSLGANPRAQSIYKNLTAKSAIELAAVLMYPEILEQILKYLDETPGLDKHVFDETWALQAAHDKTITSIDPTTLQSRLVRLGSQYKSDMFQTLRILHDRHQRTRTWQNAKFSSARPGEQLCTEIRLGNQDIVEALLELGHDANGSLEFRPLEAAVSTNNSEIFRLLLHFGADVTKGFTVGDGRKYSFLQLLACRPQTSPPGLWIAEYLITAKLPIEPIGDGSPSAFALAVENQYFDLADLLLTKGADINVIYQHSTKSGYPQSILANLIAQTTEKSLDSIKYLVSLHSRAKPPQLNAPSTNIQNSSMDPFSILQAQMTDLSVNDTAKLNPIAIPSVKMSVVHQIAWWNSDFVSANLQITTSIIEIIVNTFSEPEDINRVHPIMGTPLCIAAMSSNIEMINALLARDACPTEAVDPEACFKACGSIFGIKYKSEYGTPIWLALAKYQTLLDEWPGKTTREKLDVSGRVTNRLLSVSSDESAEAQWKVLYDRMVAMDDEEKKVISERRNNLHEDSSVVDLSVMTEEKPSGWREGVESTQEMSLRTFLKFMRRG
jgi:serine/threonine protein kinase/ankyrin repeat protein